MLRSPFRSEAMLKERNFKKARLDCVGKVLKLKATTKEILESLVLVQLLIPSYGGVSIYSGYQGR